MPNPFANNDKTVDQLRGEMRMQRAVVTLVPPNNGSNPHVIRVSPRGEGTTETATVLTPRSGDVALPSEGDDVLIGETKSGITVVLGHLYVGDGELPSNYDGDRIITADNDVILGDEGNAVGAVTDVNIQTTKDADGHITSVSVDVERSNKVYVNE